MGSIKILDGSTGTMLQQAGFTTGCIEEWNITHTAEVSAVPAAYAEVGSDIVQTNTFGANSIKLAKHGLAARTAELIEAGVKLAKVVANGKKVAASIGPTGEMLMPLGTATPEQLYNVYKEAAEAAKAGGADQLNLETFMDQGELKLAILACLSTGLPVSASCTFENGRTLMGNRPETIAITAEALGCVAVGANCSSGPLEMVPIIEAMRSIADIDVAAKPNAGLPYVDSEGITRFPETPEAMAEGAVALVEAGASIIGGCCGTTPAHIAAMRSAVEAMEPVPFPEHRDYICSGSEYMLRSEAEAAAIPVTLTDDPYEIADLLDENEGAVPRITLDCDISEVAELVCELQTAVKSPVLFNIEDEAVSAEVEKAYCGIF